jgi:hypothetical protein
MGTTGNKHSIMVVAIVFSGWALERLHFIKGFLFSQTYQNAWFRSWGFVL